jgi:hypothetical protein
MRQRHARPNAFERCSADGVMPRRHGRRYSDRERRGRAPNVPGWTFADLTPTMGGRAGVWLNSSKELAPRSKLMAQLTDDKMA